jgi:hypothetical protein
VQTDVVDKKSMKTIVDVDEEDEAVMRMHCPETLLPGSLMCRTPIAGESPETTPFLTLLHARKRIGEDR